MHRRLVTEDSYQAEDYEAALKKAFLGTDEDFLASEVSSSQKVGSLPAVIGGSEESTPGKTGLESTKKAL